jgi:hypothetical protein
MTLSVAVFVEDLPPHCFSISLCSWLHMCINILTSRWYGGLGEGLPLERGGVFALTGKRDVIRGTSGRVFQCVQWGRC